jgi:uncharacterized protein (DUF2336 family)
MVGIGAIVAPTVATTVAPTGARISGRRDGCADQSAQRSPEYEGRRDRYADDFGNRHADDHLVYSLLSPMRHQQALNMARKNQNPDRRAAASPPLPGSTIGS